MKRSMSILLSLILVLTTVIILTPKAFADDSDVVPDLALREAVNRELGLGYGNNSPVSKSQVESLTSLNAASYYSYFEITSLKGLQYATNLTELNFDANQVSDISALSGLTNLESLHFEWNQVNDISALSDLTNLEDLNFNGNQVSNIASLSGLTNLKKLYFDNNEVNDIASLSSLTNLERLDFGNNEVSDVEALNDLTNLGWLGFSSNQVSDIGALSDLTNLQELSFGSNEVSDISALSGLTNLKKLYFEDNQVSDIGALSDLTNLEELYFYSNKVSDITPLSALINLKKLSFDNNEVSDINALSSLINLQDLFFQENRVGDISPIKDIVEANNTSVDASAQKIEMFLDSPYEFENLITGKDGESLDLSYVPEEVSKNGTIYKLDANESDVTWSKIYTGYDLFIFGGTITARKTVMENPEEPLPEGYNRVEFKGGAHGSLNGITLYAVKNGKNFSEVSVPSVNPSEGYTFDDWEPELPEGTETVTEDMTFTAKYKEDIPPIEIFTVKFEAGDNGSLTGTTEFTVIGGDLFSVITVPSVNPSEGYTFDGWNPELPEGTETVTEDMTFTATYKEDVPPVETFTVKFESGENGSLTGTTEFTVNEGELFSVVTVPSVTPSAGYTFDGWNPELPEGTETVTEDMTFTAQYSIYTQEFEMKRLSGKTRYDTAVEVSKEMGNESEYVIIVNGRQYPDALSSTPLAKLYSAPILLVKRNEIPASTKEEIERLGASKAIIVGGKGVVSESVASELEGMGLTLERYSGKDRYKTALAVAEKVVGMSEGTNLILVKGTDFPDALTVTSLALKEEIPILLTNPNVLGTEVQSFIEEQSPSKLYIAGGKGAVSLEIESDIEDLGISVTRFSGKDRYETGKEIAEYTYPSPNEIIFANGRDFADAMVGGPLTTVNGGPVMLVGKNHIPQATKNYITPTVAEGVNKAYIVGGNGVVSEGVKTELTGILD